MQGAIVFGTGIVTDAPLIATAVIDGHLAILLDELGIRCVDFIHGWVFAGKWSMVVIGEKNRARALLPIDQIPGACNAGIIIHGPRLLIDERIDVGDIEKAILREEIQCRATHIFLVAVDGFVKQFPMNQVGGFQKAKGKGRIAFVIGLEQHDIAFSIKCDGGVEEVAQGILEDFDGVAPVDEVIGNGHADARPPPGSLVADLDAIAIAFAIGDKCVDEVVLIQDDRQLFPCGGINDDSVIRLSLRLGAIDCGDIEQAVIMPFEHKRCRLANVRPKMPYVMPNGSVHGHLG